MEERGSGLVACLARLLQVVVPKIDKHCVQLVCGDCVNGKRGCVL